MPRLLRRSESHASYLACPACPGLPGLLGRLGGGRGGRGGFLLGDRFRVGSAEVTVTDDNVVLLAPGDSITLRDLLYAALVQSDNIAAYTLAYHVGSGLGSVEDAKLTPDSAIWRFLRHA